MIVISDTSTIVHLNNIGKVDLLEKIFSEILIPEAVYDELAIVPSQKQVVDKNQWIKVVAVSDIDLYLSLRRRWDHGASEAIALSIELQPDFLVIDEKKGRKIASEYGIEVIGLLGILKAAKDNKEIENLEPLIDDLV